jgi:ATP synthase protein I
MSENARRAAQAATEQAGLRPVSQEGRVAGLNAGSIESADGAQEFKVWSAGDVRALLAAQETVSMWRVLAVQALVGVLLVLLAALKDEVWAQSVAAGVLPVWLSALVSVRMWSGRRRAGAGGALLGLVAWELVKMVMTVACLLAAVKVVSGLHWPAVLLGLIVSMKAGWLYLWLGRKRLTFSKNL